jgi:hypothetical protein
MPSTESGVTSTPSLATPADTVSVYVDDVAAAWETTTRKLGATPISSQHAKTFPPLYPKTRLYAPPSDEGQSTESHTHCTKSIQNNPRGKGSRAFVTAAANVNAAAAPRNTVDSLATYSADAATACSTTDVDVPTPPNDADRARLENTDRKEADK